MRKKIKKFLDNENELIRLDNIEDIKRGDKRAQKYNRGRKEELLRIKRFLMRENDPKPDLGVKSFFCTNCWGEYSIEELGLFITSEDNKLAYFCPQCGFWEFCIPGVAPPEEEVREILEDGPKEVYEYPDKIIKPIKDNWFKKEHKSMLKEYKERLEKKLQEKTNEFKYLFNNS
jgi:hypothetical protein